MTDKSAGPYVVVEKEGKFIVDVPGLLLNGKNKSDAEMWCEAFNDCYAAGFKAGLEWAARIIVENEERRTTSMHKAYLGPRDTGNVSGMGFVDTIRECEGGVGPRGGKMTDREGGGMTNDKVICPFCGGDQFAHIIIGNRIFWCEEAK